MRRLVVLLLAVAALTALARGVVPCAAMALQPRCYVALHPGPTADTLGVVAVAGQPTYASSGKLLLTTVAVDPVLHGLEWVRTAVSPRIRQMPRRELYPTGAHADEVHRRHVSEMDASQLDATAAALGVLGYRVDLSSHGAEVVEVLPGSPAAANLQPGDVISSVDGRPVRDAEQMVRAVQDLTPGQPVVLVAERGGERRVARLTAVADPALPGEAWLGVVVRDRVSLPVEVKIDSGRVGGPSAGLMFALAIVDRLTADDLTGGRVIAGSGIIDTGGRVGAVGGIQQKILGALEQADPPAMVFLVPRANLPEARGAPVDRSIVLVPVSDLEGTLAALRQLKAGRVPVDAVALGPL